MPQFTAAELDALRWLVEMEIHAPKHTHPEDQSVRPKLPRVLAKLRASESPAS